MDLFVGLNLAEDLGDLEVLGRSALVPGRAWRSGSAGGTFA